MQITDWEDTAKSIPQMEREFFGEKTEAAANDIDNAPAPAIAVASTWPQWPSHPDVNYVKRNSFGYEGAFA